MKAFISFEKLNIVKGKMHFYICFVFILYCAYGKSQTTFRDAFLGKYFCLVKITTSTQISYENRFLNVSIDSAFSNRIILADSLWNPYLFNKAVNLYLDSTFRDTISSATGGLFYGHFFNPDSIYFHRAVVGGPGGGFLMEYFGKRTTVGVKENTHEIEIILFPNPAVNEFNIILPSLTEQMDFQILDINGRLVLEQKFKATTQINVGTLPKGVYVVRIKGVNLNLSKRVVLLD